MKRACAFGADHEVAVLTGDELAVHVGLVDDEARGVGDLRILLPGRIQEEGETLEARLGAADREGALRVVTTDVDDRVGVGCGLHFLDLEAARHGERALLRSVSGNGERAHSCFGVRARLDRAFALHFHRFDGKAARSHFNGGVFGLDRRHPEVARLGLERGLVGHLDGGVERAVRLFIEAAEREAAGGARCAHRLFAFMTFE